MISATGRLARYREQVKLSAIVIKRSLWVNQYLLFSALESYGQVLGKADSYLFF